MKIMIAYPPLEGKGSPMFTQKRQFQWNNVGSYIYFVIPANAASLLTEQGHKVMWEDCIATQKPAEVFFKELMVIRLVPRNIISFVYSKSMIYWRQLNEGGCHVAKISSNTDQGGAERA